MTEGSIPKKRTTFYLDPNIHQAFKKVCLREGVVMSEKIEKFEARYISVHGEGNPQLCLERFIGEPKFECFRCEGRFPALFKVQFISGLIANVCRECLEVYKKQTTVKKIMGVVGRKR